MSAVMTEATPITASGLPERDKIELKPCKGYPRWLILEWDRYGVLVSMSTGKFQPLAWARAQHTHISLVSRRISELIYYYCLYAGEASFRLSRREFDTLRAWLEPRGVEVRLPEEAA